MALGFEESAADGIQPQDNPDPASLGQPSGAPIEAAPMPNVFAQGQSAPVSPMVTETMDGQAPVQPPMPAAEVESKDPDDSAVDAILADMKGKEPEPVRQANEVDSEIEALLDGAISDNEPVKGLVQLRLPGESVFDSIVRVVPEHLKVIGAEMRGRIDANPKNMLAAFQGMYGKDNVKVMGGKVMFRPEEGQKFRSVDEGLFNSLTDFILFNALGGAPLAANVATEMAGAPIAAAVPALAPVVGAAGGTVEALTRQGIQGGLNAVSEVDQERESLTKDILWTAGLNAAAPLVVRAGVSGARAAGRGLYQVPQVARFADTIFDTASKQAEWVGTEAAQKLSQIRLGFNEMRKQLFPESVGKSQATVGQELMGAVEAEQLRLGREIGVIKEQALALAEEKGWKSQGTNAKKKVSETLKKYGYYTDPETGLLEKQGERTAVYRVDPVFSEDVLGRKVPTNRTEEQVLAFNAPKSGVSGFDGGLQQLADFHNRLVGESIADGGTKLSAIFNDLDLLLDPKSKWGEEAGKALSGIYREVRGAVASDRNELIDQLFFGEGQLGGEAQKLTGQVWKKAFQKFSQNQDAVARMKTTFYRPEERKVMVDAFNKASNADKNQFIEDVAHVLGSDSKEFNMFRGSLFENLVESSVKPSGVVDAKKISRALVDPSNQEYLGKIFNKQEIATLNRMAVEGQNILEKYEPTEQSMGIFVKGFKTLTKYMDPAQMVKTLFGVSGSSKTLVDYMTDKGFLELMEQAQTPEIKMNLLRAKTMTENAVSKMRIIGEKSAFEKGGLKTPMEKGLEKSIQRYAPLAGPAMATMVDRMLQPQPALMGEPKY